MNLYNGPSALSIDAASAVTVDGAGNTYVTGQSQGNNTKLDFVTIKYDVDGNELWVARHNGADSLDDVANAIAVDGDGNVYVSGYTQKVYNGNDYDYCTIKYSPVGNELWVTHYDGPNNTIDEAKALTVDGVGNVYVTGYSSGVGTWSDYATIKYDTDGNQIWVSRYNGPSDYSDVPSAIAIDGNGNVYLTGRSPNPEDGSVDYLTIKYSSIGNELWVARYNGPLQTTDIASALVLDVDGNVYVTGTSPGLDTLSDYCTIKYSPVGTQLWVVRYDSGNSAGDVAASLAVDSAGSVYVTGVSSGVWGETYDDYATVKYDTNGNQIWVSRFNGTGSKYDAATALALDSSGNIYVTGISNALETSNDYCTVKYDSDGQQIWARYYDGGGNDWDKALDLITDGDGSVYVTGYSKGFNSGDDYATVKYDTNGNTMWASRYDGPPANGEDKATDIAADGSGNIYVTGYSMNANFDYATIKYDPTGSQLWVARHDGPYQGDDYADALATDNNGNTYVTGYSLGADGIHYDYATVSYDANGNELWAARYDAKSYTPYYDVAVGFDSAGNIYVTGTGDGDYATLKYDSDGNQAWVARYDGPAHGLDRVTALHVDTAGNAHVTGWSEGVDSGDDWCTIKYDTNGNELWLVRYDNANGKDRPVAITTDTNGGIYVAGFRDDSSAIIKYDASGNQLWLKADYVDKNITTLSTVIIDDVGYIYAAGHGVSYIFTSKYRQDNGVRLWRRSYPDGQDVAGMVVDNTGNVCVAGPSHSLPYYAFVTIKYDVDGNQLWLAQYDGETDGSDYPNGLAMDGNGNVYVTGSTQYGGFNNSDYATVKYSETQNQCPIIDEIKPYRRLPGEKISIYGSGFGDEQSESIVKIGPKEFDGDSPKIKIWTDALIKIKIPAYKCSWFKGKNRRSRKVQVIVPSCPTSNEMKFMVKKPDTCP